MVFKFLKVEIRDGFFETSVKILYKIFSIVVQRVWILTNSGLCKFYYDGNDDDDDDDVSDDDADDEKRRNICANMIYLSAYLKHRNPVTAWF